MSRRRTAELVVIWWRDIPAQVNAQLGRERHQIVLPERFQRAIDRAKRKAGITTAAADVAQWRRRSRPLTGDPAEAAAGEARRLEELYDRSRLARIAANGGHDPAGAESPHDTAPAASSPTPPSPEEIP
ncbi:MAG: hypothetical protein D6683_02550 [Actinomyces sp.]|nr:MAG: hypothetical protein D6683_02550 [Actinomyces sp.]